MKIVCSKSHLYHYLFNDNEEIVKSILEGGLCPLSDFPESERWKEIQAHRPGFFEWIYESFAKSIIQKSYENSGIFLTPIDFYQLPNTFLYDKRRIAIPIEELDTDYAAMTYVYQEERVSLALDKQVMEDVAELWQEDLVREWFGKDPSKVFFYVPQVVYYQRIPISAAHIEKPA